MLDESLGGQDDFVNRKTSVSTRYEVHSKERLSEVRCAANNHLEFDRALMHEGGIYAGISVSM